MLFLGMVCYAKIEVTPGTDSVPTGTDAMLTTGLTRNPYAGPTIIRQRDKISAGADPTINTNPRAEFATGVEFAGSAAVDTPLPYGPLLRCCGVEETVTASTDVTYTLRAPGDSNAETVSLYFERAESGTSNSERQRSLGMMGNFSINLANEQIPLWQFDSLWGSYIQPVATTGLTADVTDFVDPVIISDTYTTTVTLDGVDLCLESYTYNVGNTLERSNRPNCAQTRITNREGTGTIVFRAPDVSTKNWIAELESHSALQTSVMQIVHGTTAGNIMQIDHPALQLGTITEQNVNGEVYYSTTYRALPTSAGNDEWQLVKT